MVTVVPYEEENYILGQPHKTSCHAEDAGQAGRGHEPLTLLFPLPEISGVVGRRAFQGFSQVLLGPFLG